MRYILVTLALVNAVYGGRVLPQSGDISFKEPRKREVTSSETAVVSENARVFSQKDQLFPARYFYPTYPEYIDSRYPNGYNGQLVPTPKNQRISDWSTAWTKLIPITSFALLYGAKAGIYLFSLLLIITVGVVFTTTICTFTPICIISFPAFSLTKNQVKEQMAELAKNYITAENLNAATAVVQNAVDKYANFETTTDEKENMTNQTNTTIKPTSSTQPSS